MSQKIRLHRQTGSENETDPTAYLTYSDFESTILKGKVLESASPEGSVVVGKIFFTSTLEKVKRLVGKPKRETRGVPFDNVRAYLDYDGLLLDYIKDDKDEPDSKFEFRDLKITTSAWSLSVGEANLRPGMSAEELRPAIRQVLDPDFAESPDKFGAVRVLEPGAERKPKQGEELQLMEAMAIQVFVNKDTVSKVVLKRTY